ncbi:Thioredoxin Asp f 29 [Cladobotryum mycophilum]|uniref:Thioredoxin Asp f 29 n=1 Tax=Cladobotryum mycophilum TaxID=491253 RepID=A0ABR0S7D5_9HYPO
MGVHIIKSNSNDDEFKDIYFIKFDTDEVADPAERLGVRAYPTYQFYRGGEQVGELIEGSPQRLTQNLTQLAT